TMLARNRLERAQHLSGRAEAHEVRTLLDEMDARLLPSLQGSQVSTYLAHPHHRIHRRVPQEPSKVLVQVATLLGGQLAVDVLPIDVVHRAVPRRIDIRDQSRDEPMKRARRPVR